MNSHPSGWERRLPVVALALAGVVLASYLMAYQLGWFGSVWEPFFGPGSRIVLHAGLKPPLPDAGFGALAYLIEALGEAIGDPRRAVRAPLWVLGLFALSAAMMLGSAGLVLAQALWVKHFCTLCLASAGLSLVICPLMAPEARVAYQAWRNARARTRQAT